MSDTEHQHNNKQDPGATAWWETSVSKLFEGGVVAMHLFKHSSAGLCCASRSPYVVALANSVGQVALVDVGVRCDVLCPCLVVVERMY